MLSICHHVRTAAGDCWSALRRVRLTFQILKNSKIVKLRINCALGTSAVSFFLIIFKGNVCAPQFITLYYIHSNQTKFEN